jgi:hypothetical protein
MAARKPFLLRLDPETFAALQRWAADDLRSVNGQVEYLLRLALGEAGRLGSGTVSDGPGEPGDGDRAAAAAAEVVCDETSDDRGA